MGATSLELDAEPAGLLGLEAADGSLGGLTLPRGIATDGHGTVLLVQPTCVLRLDRARRVFAALPNVGGEGHDARSLAAAKTAAVSGHDLYVADPGNHQVQVFDLRSLTLVRIWQRAGWDPADVAAGPGSVYVLDAAHGRIYRNDAGSDTLQAVITRTGRAGGWSRIALDREGRVYALDAAEKALDVFAADGRSLGRITAAGTVRDRFDPPAVRSDARDRLVVAGLDDVRFDKFGQPVVRPPDEASGPAVHLSRGQWTSPALDSGIHRCQWHRIELDLAALPVGTSVVVSTHSEAEENGPLPPGSWETGHVLTGQVQPTGKSDALKDEFLVQSRPGRYLRVRIELCGNGHATAIVRAVRVHYPRQSYLEFLPAVYSADEVSRWFLERYLSVMQTEWDEIADRLLTIERYFGVDSAPDDFPRYLGAWLALPVGRDWTPDQVRVALRAAGRIYPKRGTPAAIRDWLVVWLTVLTGSQPADDGLPQLVEGHTRRRWLALTTAKAARLGTGAPLWGPGVVGRLQLDVFARESNVRLVSTGDPERDVFDEFAHRFSVFLPASWVRTARDEAMIRHCVDDERPAHTAYDLCLVEARTRVGVQSTVGVDTIVGARPVARLACRHGGDRPPSRASEHHLGHDMVLAGTPSQGPGLRVKTPRTTHPYVEPRSLRD